ASCSDEDDTVKANPADGGAITDGGGSTSDAASDAGGDAGPAQCPGQPGVTREVLAQTVTQGMCMSPTDLDTICAVSISKLTGSCGVAALTAAKGADAAPDPSKLLMDTLMC